MKQLLLKMTMGVLCMTLLNATPARAEEPPAPIGIIQVIKAGIKKVIKAIDLKIQRLQNKTIWLQNAQKTIENTLSKLKLTEISEWTERQRDLYKGYYEELVKVKSVISYYQRIREITKMQAVMMEEYQTVWLLLQQDHRFTPDELGYMEKVYSGMLDTSLENLDQIFLVIEAFATQMSDAKRLEIINQAADRVEQTYFDLKRFNRQNILLSLQRAKSESEAEAVRQLYGMDH